MQINEMNFTANNPEEKVIESTGTQGEWGINASSILSRLIQEAGRYCNHYASDLFIIWNAIQNRINKKTLETKRYLFGFRENGVDENQLILTRYNKDGDYIANHFITSLKYRSIWILDVEVQNDGKDGHLEMKLFEACKIPSTSEGPTLPWN